MHHTETVARQGYGSHRPRVVSLVAAAWAAQLAFFTLYALQERQRIGHWPTMGDPATLGPIPHPVAFLLLAYGFVVVTVLSAIWSFWVCLETFAFEPVRLLRVLLALIVVWAPLVIALIFLPPGLFEWFWD